jgi:mannose-6-phosphate isomerase class I
MPRVLICIDGSGWLESDGTAYGVDKGQVWLLPAVAGACVLHPNKAVNILEIVLPE